jgi:hypothetical protein
LIDKGAETPYTIQFLMEEKKDIVKSELQNALRRNCGNVEPMQESELLAFAHMDYVIRFQEGMVPAQCMFTQPEEVSNLSEIVSPSTSQTWDWPEAEAAIARCKYVVTATDILATTLARETRLKLIHGFTKSLLELLPVVAIHWLPSQRVVQPEHYLQGQQHGQLLSAAINVRMFRLEQSEERIMDTMGLRAFGVSDVQCHFKNVDPGKIGFLLFDYAQYLFTRGDVIKTGDTLQGMDAGDRWTCRREMAMVAPTRPVLDIDPGIYSAR